MSNRRKLPTSVYAFTVPELKRSSRAIYKWLKYFEESLLLFHAYAEQFKDPLPGGSVFLLVLKDALELGRGIALEDFQKQVKRGS